MTLRSPFVVNSEFDDFLFATLGAGTAGPIGDEPTEMPTTVLSALARLDIDPWQEAARLSALPKERAAAAIGQWIGRSPGGQWKPSDIAAIAARLADLLPRGGTDGAGPPVGRKTGFTAVLWLAGLALGATMLFTLFTGQGGAPDGDRSMPPPATGPIVPGR